VSQFAQSNGDDYPDAARKHLLDAQALLAAQRHDGAAYLCGYVVECALKSLIVLEGKTPPQTHRIDNLRTQVNRLAVTAGARAARYLGHATQHLAAAAITHWTPEMRYHAPAMTLRDAQAWFQEADDVFQETIQQMQIDGVI